MQEHTEDKPAWWVWTSKGTPRKHQKISLLAVGETILSAIAVWGIAWYFDSYGWLLYSLIISPLLLLRSPESMDAGVRWINKEWITDDDYKQWSKQKKITFALMMALLCALIVFWPSFLLAEFMLADQSGWRLALLSVGYGFLIVVLAGAVAGAVAGAGAGAGAGAWAVDVDVAVAVAGALALAGALAGAGAGAVGVLIRALILRTLATVTHWVIGLKQLALSSMK